MNVFIKTGRSLNRLSDTIAQFNYLSYFIREIERYNTIARKSFASVFPR